MRARDRSPRPRFAELLRGFASDERGAATIELVVWIPFFFLLFFVVVESSVFYWRYVTMWDAARDAARSVSVGTLAGTDDAVNTFVQTLVGDDFTGSIMNETTIEPMITVEAPPAALSILGIFSAVIDDNITASVRMRREPF